MPGDEVQVSARVSPAERDAIRAHGGLVHLIRKFLADNATEEEEEEEERLIGGKKALEAQKKEIEAQRTPYFWGGCDCGDEVVHLKGRQACLKCKTVATGRPDARVDDVVSAKLKGEI